jgi:hypothetical protein
MVIAEMLIVLSSITSHDTTILPRPGKTPTTIKSDTLAKKVTEKPLEPIKTKVEKGSLLKKVKRGGWDGN